MCLCCFSTIDLNMHSLSLSSNYQFQEMDVMDSVMPDLNSLQQDSAENNSIPTSQNGDAVDLSSPGFTDTFPTKSTSELPLDEESINLMEVPQSDSCIHVEDLPEVPSKLVSYLFYKLFCLNSYLQLNLCCVFHAIRLLVEQRPESINPVLHQVSSKLQH